MGYEFLSRIRYSECDQHEKLTLEHLADYFQDCTVFHDEDGVLFEGTRIRRFPNGKEVQTYSIPDSAAEIGEGAFEGCSSLTRIDIPGSVTKIGNFHCCFSVSVHRFTV